MRERRLRIIGQLWRLMRGKSKNQQPSKRPTETFFTLIPDGWSVSLGDLHLVLAWQWMNTVLADFYRAGAAAADGWCFFALHAAYDSTTQTYALHVHGIATDGLIAVIDRMRSQRKYTPARPFDQRDRANTPIRMTRKPLYDLPRVITYVMRGWWPLRVTKLDEQGMRVSLDIARQRIPEPAHSEYLLWLDRWGIEDLTRMIHLRVVDGKLKPR